MTSTWIKENPTATMFSCLGVIVVAFGISASVFAVSLGEKVGKDQFQEALRSIAKETQSIRDDTAKEFDRRERIAGDLGRKIECLTKELSMLNTIMARLDERWKQLEREK